MTDERNFEGWTAESLERIADRAEGVLAAARHPYPPEARHDWRAMLGYRLTDEEAYKLANQSNEPDAPPLVPIYPGEEDKVDAAIAVLRVEQIDPTLQHIVCLRCEVTHEAAAGYPCPGDPVAHADGGTGEPIYEVRHTGSDQVRRVTWGRWVEMHDKPATL